MIKWEEKGDTEKTWATCKSYFKYLFAKQKIYNKVMDKNWFQKSSKREGKKHSLWWHHQGNVWVNERHIKNGSGTYTENSGGQWILGGILPAECWRVVFTLMSWLSNEPTNVGSLLFASNYWMSVLMHGWMTNIRHTPIRQSILPVPVLPVRLPY